MTTVDQGSATFVQAVLNKCNQLGQLLQKITALLVGYRDEEMGNCQGQRWFFNIESYDMGNSMILQQFEPGGLNGIFIIAKG